jgi:nucleotide-binding universal stress UspA family protein
MVPMSSESEKGPALLCWDGSASSRRAIEQAGQVLGPGYHAVLFFAYVPTESARGILGGLSGPDAPIMGVSDAEILVEQGIAAARDAGFEASGHAVVAERKTAEVIVATAEEVGAPVIVMGQRGRSAIGTVLLGSVARDVINNSAHRPVMVVAPSAPGPGSAAPARPGG